MEERGDGEFELAGIRAGGGGVLGVWGRELARERGDWNAEVPLVLKRTREGELGLFLELATAAARWRPRSTIGVAWRGKGGSSAGGVVPVGCGGAACGSGQQEVASRPPGAAAAPLYAGGRGSREGERRKTQAGLVCNFRKV